MDATARNTCVVNGGVKHKAESGKFPLTVGEVATASAVVFGFVFGLVGVYLTMPASDYSFLKLPRSLEDLQVLRYSFLAIFVSILSWIGFIVEVVRVLQLCAC